MSGRAVCGRLGLYLWEADVGAFMDWVGARAVSESSGVVVARFVHRDGRGLMNNSSLDYGRLSDDDALEVEEEMLGLRQPPRDLHGMDLVFAFTPEGERRHARLIALLRSASRSGVVREELPLSAYEVAWDSGDGQLAMRLRGG